MGLKKYAAPKYRTTLPVSGKVVDYSPYTIKEEKNVLFAVASQNTENVIQAVKELIEMCCVVKVEELHPVDVEWLYIQLYKASVQSDVFIDMPLQCDNKQEGCPAFIKIKASLENLVIEGKDTLTQQGYKHKDGVEWLVPIEGESFIQFSLREKPKENDSYKLLWDAFICFIDGEEVVNKEDTNFEEFKDFIDSLPPFISAKISALFEFQPYIMLEVKGMCPCCKQIQKAYVQDIISFLE